MNETIVAYWIVTAQAATMHQEQKGKMICTAAAADQTNNDEPTEMEEATEQLNSVCVVVQVDTDPNKFLIHTMKPSTQTLVTEGNVVTLNNVQTVMSKDRDDKEQYIGGAEPLSMENPDRRTH